MDLTHDDYNRIQAIYEAVLFLNEDCEPAKDAPDPNFWHVVEEAMSKMRADLAMQARTNNSISFRRHVVLFVRAERICRREQQKARQLSNAAGDV